MLKELRALAWKDEGKDRSRFVVDSEVQVRVSQLVLFRQHLL